MNATPLKLLYYKYTEVLLEKVLFLWEKIRAHMFYHKNHLFFDGLCFVLFRKYVMESNHWIVIEKIHAKKVHAFSKKCKTFPFFWLLVADKDMSSLVEIIYICCQLLRTLKKFQLSWANKHSFPLTILCNVHAKLRLKLLLII